MPRWFLNIYRPLVATSYGRRSSQEHGILPFVDGSIRREPDLEHRFPSISCLCRAGKFAPRLALADVVGYLTTKGKYGEIGSAHWRLTAVLRVNLIFASHVEAGRWYLDHGHRLPSNCLVTQNPPKPIEYSHRKHSRAKDLDDARLQRVWDREYHQRAGKFGTFIVCEAIFKDLSWYAPVVEPDQLRDAFGRIPGMQNPGPLAEDGFNRLMELLGISVPPSSP